MTENETALALRPAPLSGYIPPPSKDEFASMISMANNLAKAQGFLPAHFYEQPYKILAAILYGRDLGISATNALQHIIVIEGKATADAQLIGMLVRRAGHQMVDTTTAEASTVKITRSDGTIHEATFTMQDAQRAGLVRAGGAWQKYPAAMLYARALTACARKGAQDALMGVAYSPEELGAEVNENGNVIDVTPRVPTGEIPSTEATPESVAALHEAQGSDQTDKAVAGTSAPVVTPAPPVASEKPKSGPRAKRGNVVQAPQAAEKPAMAPQAGSVTITGEAAARVLAPPSQPAPVALDDGEEVYRAELRHQARNGAAVLRLLRIKMKNSEAALNGQALQPEPPATPNKDSEESLALFVNAKFPGKTLDTLAEVELEAVVNQIDELVTKVQAQVK
jgi:hypothetical protein